MIETIAGVLWTLIVLGAFVGTAAFLAISAVYLVLEGSAALLRVSLRRRIRKGARVYPFGSPVLERGRHRR